MALGLNGKMGEAEAMMRRDLPPDAADRNLAWLRARSGPAPADQARTWGSLQGG
jgi:Flp pilus assembly protein TadD